MPAIDPFAFYTALAVRQSFAEVTHPEVYTALPDDWVVVIGDVEGSTGAIARGQYKEVNLVGSSMLMATFNALGRSDLPFIFGGDGSTLALPAEVLARATPALLATRKMARDGFNLGLRVGVVPMREIRAAGQDVRVARVRLSERFALAAFWGEGLAWAERLVKDPEAGAAYRLEGEVTPDDKTFAGLECRWRPVPSELGETVALLVLATASNPAEQARVYETVLDRMRKVFGEQAGGHPVAQSQLQLGRGGAAFEAEARVQRSQASRWRRAVFKIRIHLEVLAGRFLMARKVKTPAADWGRYKEQVARLSDFQKFDGLLRMVLSATPGQRAELVAWLEERQSAGELAFGLHVAKEALVTCLIFEREGGHLHFIDGADGGYARAAVDLKARLAEKPASRWGWASPKPPA
ncbi:MAG: DUF3095 domain-containing protein [Opitutales bacterium]|jgi:hypothetical protein